MFKIFKAQSFTSRNRNVTFRRGSLSGARLLGVFGNAIVKKRLHSRNDGLVSEMNEHCAVDFLKI